MPRLAPRISGLSRWLRRGKASGGADGTGAGSTEDPLLVIGRLLRQEREARGLNLRQMALETRISTPVLEALERGWRDRLPEGTYLRTMLRVIERKLELPAGSLDAALPPQQDRPGADGRKGGLLRRFTPGSIDVFSTWQGSVLYAALVLGLIYGINLQQRELAAANVLSLQPIPPRPASEQAKPASQAITLLSVYPDLRPLQQAGRGRGLQALQQTARQPDEGPGVLQLNLSQASSISLSSEGGGRSQLKGAQGELVLQLRPPLQLAITPAPKAGEVSWNGQPLAAVAKRPGLFRLPQPEPAQPQRP